MRTSLSRLVTALIACLVSATGVTIAVADSPPMAKLVELNAKYADPAQPPGKGVLTKEDEAFLDDLQWRGIQFFIDEADPVTGLMPDRGLADGSGKDVASIASVGFGLTSLCIGVERGWVSKEIAYARSLRVLKFLLEKAPHERGHFYHFMEMRTGKRAWDCEVSNIDTALLMAGVLTVRQQFPDTELAKIATKLYERVEWGWLLQEDGNLSMGWKPESGFIKAKWDVFNEGFLIHLLGMGSPTHPLPAKSWHDWQRKPVFTYAGLTFLQCPPLFTHQYPQCWFDLRGLRDDYADYYRNSQLATLAQREWCMTELKTRYPHYSENLWGISASDSAHGYDAWGGPPEQGQIDGSVVPCAVAGSLPFQPRLCMDALHEMRKRCGEKGYLKYGFVDAFQPDGSWFNEDVIGIDIGATVLMAENCRSGFVWRTFMSCPEVQASMKAAGFRPLSAEDKTTPASSILRR